MSNSNVLYKRSEEILKEMIEISGTVDKLRSNMYYLDIEGKKDCQEYKKNLHYTIVVTEEEQKMIDKLSIKDCEKLKEYLIIGGFIDNTSNDFEHLLLQNYDGRILRKINSILEKRLLFEKVIPRIDDISYAFERVCCLDELKEFFDKEMIKLFLFYLEDCIQKEQSLSVRNDLMKAKYMFSLMNGTVQNELLNCSFLTSPLKPKQSICEFNISASTYLEIKNSYHLKIILKQIEELLKLSNQKCEETEILITAILRICVLKSAFNFMNFEAIELANHYFDKMLNKLENKDNFSFIQNEISSVFMIETSRISDGHQRKQSK